MAGSLYIHIPFCPKVCPYCSFYKEVSEKNQFTGFVDAVLQELDGAGAEWPTGGVRTIFLGGGTPTALPTPLLHRLLAGVRSRVPLHPAVEWTIEMNPATVSSEKALMIRDCGVNRVSMGVQSWDPALLLTLGRVHSAGQALRSYEILRESGFTNVNLDLIFGIPGQSLGLWRESLRRTIDLQPDHISAYCLTYEEDTEYFNRLQRGLYHQDTDEDARFFETTTGILESAGYAQYEISNFARTDRECRHNLGYWRGEDFVGLGPSAWSTVGLRRWQNVPDTSAYIQGLLATGAPPRSVESLTPEIRRGESMAFGIRTSEGVPVAELRSSELAELEPWTSEGMTEQVGDRLRLTRSGRLLADSIAEIFVAEPTLAEAIDPAWIPARKVIA